MARKVSFSALESRSARLQVDQSAAGPTAARRWRAASCCMYRRNKTNGTWVLKVSDGHGAYWTKAFALADDFEDADGKTVLTFYQAQDQAKKLARGDDGGAETAPITVDGALNGLQSRSESAQCQSLQRRMAARASHQRAAVEAGGIARVHRTEEMARRPARHDGTVDDQPALRLPERRTGAGGAARQAHPEPGCLGNRTGRSAECASKPATSSCPTTRCANLSPPPTGSMIKFGLLTDTLAVTGARPSQAVRLRVEDLHDHPVRPKLMMPKSAKGGDRNRAEKKTERYSVPITVQLAARLKAAAWAVPTMRRCCCKATAAHGATIPAQAIIARSKDRRRHRRRS